MERCCSNQCFAFQGRGTLGRGILWWSRGVSKRVKIARSGHASCGFRRDFRCRALRPCQRASAAVRALAVRCPGVSLSARIAASLRPQAELRVLRQCCVKLPLLVPLEWAGRGAASGSMATTITRPQAASTLPSVTFRICSRRGRPTTCRNARSSSRPRCRAPRGSCRFVGTNRPRRGVVVVAAHGGDRLRRGDRRMGGLGWAVSGHYAALLRTAVVAALMPRSAVNS